MEKKNVFPKKYVELRTFDGTHIQGEPREDATLQENAAESIGRKFIKIIAFLLSCSVFFGKIPSHQMGNIMVWVYH